MKILLGILAFGTAMFWLAIHSYRPLDQNLAFEILGFSFLAGAAVLAWGLKRNHADSSDSYVPKPQYVAVACLPCLLALALFLNVLLDGSAPKQYQAIVLRKTETPLSNCITVTSWRTGRTAESIPVDASVYAQLPQSGPILVSVKPGLLHLPWVAGFGRIDRLNVRAR